MFRDAVQWIERSWLSSWIQNHYWMIAASQSVHLVCVAIVLASAAMISLRLLGVGRSGRSVSELIHAQLPWLYGALGVLLLTGTLQTIAEPQRQFVTPAFWYKMLMVLTVFGATRVFERAARTRSDQWNRRTPWLVRGFALSSLTLWIAIIFCGRFIAYTWELHAGNRWYEMSGAEWLQLIDHSRLALWVGGDGQGEGWFPVFESLHLIFLALLFGTLAMWDLRLLGVISRSSPFLALRHELLPWVWVAFSGALVTGGFLFCVHASIYASNPQFRFKMLFLLLAGLNMLMFQLPHSRRMASWHGARAPLGAQAAAVLSILLWCGVVVLGRWIGFAT